MCSADGALLMPICSRQPYDIRVRAVADESRGCRLLLKRLAGQVRPEHALPGQQAA